MDHVIEVKMKKNICTCLDTWNGPCKSGLCKPKPEKSDFLKSVEELHNIKSQNIETYIKVFLDKTGMDISELVLCHEYIPNGWKVWLDLKNNHETKDV